MIVRFSLALSSMNLSVCCVLFDRRPAKIVRTIVGSDAIVMRDLVPRSGRIAVERPANNAMD
jgi:hypothetical protein